MMGIKNNSNSVYFLYVILLFVTILPLLIFKYPVLVDYQNHLASFYIQANIDNDLWLKENYRIEWVINPYTLIEALGGLLARYMDVFIVGKIIIILGFLFIISGVMLIRRNIVGHIDLWVVIAFVCLYNHMLFWGFLNYYVGSGIALIAMGVWINLRNIGFIRHFLLFSAISTLLFFTHLFALGVYAVFVLSYEIGVYIYSKDRFSLSNFPKAIFQFLLPSGLFFIWWTIFNKPGDGEVSNYGGISEKVIALLSPISFDFSRYSLNIILIMMVLILIVRIIYPKGVGIYDAMKVPVVCFIIFTIIIPTQVGGVIGIDGRISFIAMLLFIVSIKFDEQEKTAINLRKYIVFIVVMVVCFKIYFISNAWSKVEPQYKEFEEALRYVSPGSKIISVQEESKDLKAYDDALYKHISALAVIKRSAFWPNIFTVLTPVYPTAKTAHLNSPTDPQQLTISRLRNNKLKNGDTSDDGVIVYWENWTQDFDYLISMRFENRSVIDIKNLKLIVRGSFFDIYQIVH